MPKQSPPRELGIASAEKHRLAMTLGVSALMSSATALWSSSQGPDYRVFLLSVVISHTAENVRIKKEFTLSSSQIHAVFTHKLAKIWYHLYTINRPLLPSKLGRAHKDKERRDETEKTKCVFGYASESKI